VEHDGGLELLCRVEVEFAEQKHGEFTHSFAQRHC